MLATLLLAAPVMAGLLPAADPNPAAVSTSALAGFPTSSTSNAILSTGPNAPPAASADWRGQPYSSDARPLSADWTSQELQSAPVEPVIFEDNFDQENCGVATADTFAYTRWANWDVPDGSVDLVGNGFHDFQPGNGLYVDLDGWVSGTLASKRSFKLDPGEYELEFDLAGSQRGDVNTVTVTLGGVYSEEFTRESHEQFERITRTIQVTSPTSERLVFDHAGVGDTLGLMLDNVRLASTALGESPLIVTRADDPAPDGCATGDCSLREAIMASNATPAVRETIAFEIDTGPVKIAPTSQLPELSDEVTIDGGTQPGFSGTPIVEISGESAGDTSPGLVVSAGNSTVRGLVINRFGTHPLIALHTNDGNHIVGNYLGTNLAGDAIHAGAGPAAGVSISPTSGHNVIGGRTASERNVIAGAQFGVFLDGSDSNRMEGNYIGTNSAGTGALPNNIGVHVQSATGTVIGGTSPCATNLISGNTKEGVNVGTGADDTQIAGNLVGTTASGTAPLPNTDGVRIVSSGNTVGGPYAAARNVISGNSQNGIEFSPPASTNAVTSNLIGTDFAGSADLGNGNDGVHVAGAPDTTVGGPGVGNLIFGNNQAGVRVVDSTGTLVRHNTISDNTGPGVLAAGDTTQVALSANSIFSNGLLGIELFGGGLGPTPNDAGDGDTGPNGLQNFPTLNPTSPGELLSGTLNSRPNQSYEVEFFSSPSCDSSRFGEGQTWLGVTNVTTDDAGNVSFTSTVPAPAEGTFVTATATREGVATSEFSQCIRSGPPPPVTISPPAGGGSTSDPTPTFSGTAGDAPGDSDTVTLKIYDGSSASGTPVRTLAAPRSGTSWSVQVAPALDPGIYTAQAEQADGAGTVTRSGTHTFTVTGATSDGGGGGGGAGGGAAAGGAGTGAGGGAAGASASQQPPPPTVGKTFNAETVSGVITFKCGSGPQRPLEEAEQLPIGCRIDARRGKVEITSAAGNGKTQSAVFSGGLFVVRQKAGPKPVTELRLVGKLENCPAPGSVSTAARPRVKPGRRLWGKGKGAFRTRGRRSAATVTGTKWLVEDRCDGSTLTKVFLGRVKVRDFVLDKTITLTQGQSYVARPRSRGRR